MTPDLAQQVAADLVTVYRYVFTHTELSTALDNTRTGDALCEAIVAYQVPPWRTLNNVCGWVLFHTDWDAQVRPLAPSEQLAREAAERLSDALHTPRIHH